jgi:hypothetical protein
MRSGVDTCRDWHSLPGAGIARFTA